MYTLREEIFDQSAGLVLFNKMNFETKHIWSSVKRKHNA